MQEIAPGLWHWTARHEHIGADVSSYYLEPERVVLDPMIPAEGITWFEEHGPPEHAVLTNRHHDRHSWDLQERFGTTVHCISNGVYELEGRGPVQSFEFGDELPGGILVHEVDAICPDETALHIPSHRALACADGVIHYGAELGFVPEQHMDDPRQTKEALRSAYARLVELDPDFDVLLMAHGTPWVGGAKDALRRFATSDE
jgi:glyoxylase-like metal-dependent hydrolase (beta-lactamase superfamily II)